MGRQVDGLDLRRLGVPRVTTTELKDVIVDEWMKYIYRVSRKTKPMALALWGPPGVGKNAAIVEAAKEIVEKHAEKMLGKKLTLINLAEEHVTFEDISKTVGRPIKTLKDLIEVLDKEPEKYFVVLRITASELAPLMSVTMLPDAKTGASYTFVKDKLRIASIMKYGILFLDELATEHLSGEYVVVNSIISEREIFGHKIDPMVFVVAAANPPAGYYGGVTTSEMLPDHTRTRLKHYEVVPPSPEDFARYMRRKYGTAWDYMVYLFLKACPDRMVRPSLEGGGVVGFPTLRAWENLALDLFYDKAILASETMGVPLEEAMRLLSDWAKADEINRRLARENLPELLRIVEMNAGGYLDPETASLFKTMYAALSRVKGGLEILKNPELLRQMYEELGTDENFFEKLIDLVLALQSAASALRYVYEREGAGAAARAALGVLEALGVAPDSSLGEQGYEAVAVEELEGRRRPAGEFAALFVWFALPTLFKIVREPALDDDARRAILRLIESLGDILDVIVTL